MGVPKPSRTERFLGITPGDVVSFVGGGGKSMLMHSLARRLAKEDRKVLVTATRSFRLAPGDSPYLFLTDERAFGLLLPNLEEHGAIRTGACADTARTRWTRSPTWATTSSSRRRARSG